MTDVQLLKFTRSFRRGLLGNGSSAGCCAMVCHPLSTLLEMHGVKNKVIESDLGVMNHVWIQLEDGRALDPTADQFWEHWGVTPKLPPVYLGAPTTAHPLPEAPRSGSTNQGKES